MPTAVASSASAALVLLLATSACATGRTRTGESPGKQPPDSATAVELARLAWDNYRKERDYVIYATRVADFVRTSDGYLITLVPDDLRSRGSRTIIEVLFDGTAKVTWFGH